PPPPPDAERLPCPRKPKHGGDRRGGGRQNDNRRGPQVISAGPKRDREKAGEDSPFASLVALKKSLEQQAPDKS
ncbi:MAG: hypothetical protein AAFO62_10515, partial [Pseudomonadota bacterium]